MPVKSFSAALLQGRCPRCRTGKMFVYPASKLSKFNVMHAQCPHCGLRLEPEPGFYQGAMYVGYAFTLALMVVISTILYLLINPESEWVYISVIIGIMVLLAPLNYRYSRIFFLHFFGGIKFDRSAVNVK
jgi:uncharacterized protein (DUF983 family)